MRVIEEDGVTTIAVTLENGEVQIIENVRMVVFSPEIVERQYVDCAKVPADLAALRRIIARDGQVRVRVVDKQSGEFANVDAVEYVKAPMDDDLVLRDGTLLSHRYWSSFWNVPYNPTRVSRAVYGYWE